MLQKMSLLAGGILLAASSVYADGRALEDLEDPAMVLDSAGDVERIVSKMQRPNDDEVREVDWTDDAAAEAKSQEEAAAAREAARNDPFAKTGDDDFDREIVREEEDLATDDDFEQAEEIDLDIAVDS